MALIARFALDATVALELRTKNRIGHSPFTQELIRLQKRYFGVGFSQKISLSPQLP